VRASALDSTAGGSPTPVSWSNFLLARAAHSGRGVRPRPAAAEWRSTRRAVVDHYAEMQPTDPDAQRLDRIIEDLRNIRTRRCEPKSNQNPTYLQLSSAVSNLLKARDTLAAE
jgi:hypothetical protein